LQNSRNLCEYASLLVREIRLFAFAIDRQQIKRRIVAVKIIDDAHATGLPASPACPTQLSHSARSANQVARQGMHGQRQDERLTLNRGKQTRSAPGELKSLRDRPKAETRVIQWISVVKRQCEAQCSLSHST